MHEATIAGSDNSGHTASGGDGSVTSSRNEIMRERLEASGRVCRCLRPIDLLDDRPEFPKHKFAPPPVVGVGGAPVRMVALAELLLQPAELAVGPRLSRPRAQVFRILTP